MSITQSRFMYCSRMASEGVINQVASIVKVAREFNASQGITGMLVFDGQNFCQYIEGPSEPLAGLVQRIRQDARHTDFHELLALEETQGRQFESWSMAYQIVESDNDLGGFFHRQGTAALEYLLNLVPELDRA